MRWRAGLGNSWGGFRVGRAGVSPGSVHHLLCDLEHATVLPEHDRSREKHLPHRTVEGFPELSCRRELSGAQEWKPSLQQHRLHRRCF